MTFTDSELSIVDMPDSDCSRRGSSRLLGESVALPISISLEVSGGFLRRVVISAGVDGLGVVVVVVL